MENPKFECKCCGLCCKRDPYYAVSLLDINNISMGMGMKPAEFFNSYCAVIETPGGFRYPAILAPEGCPFLKDRLCSIHAAKPIGCWVFPESSQLPITMLKKSVRAIESCAILEMPDDERTLNADYQILAARDIHFESTREYFKEHDEFDEPSWAEATDHLRKRLSDTKELGERAEEIRMRALSAIRRARDI